MNTLTDIRECRDPVAEYRFSDFGTDAPRDADAYNRVSAGRATGASLVLTGAAILGGLTGTTIGGAQASTVTSFVTVNRTDRGELMRIRPTKSKVVTGRSSVGAESRSDRDEVAWVKDHSGLTWDQLGKVFGVSRRAVHMWANGGRLNESNARRLREFSSLIHEAESVAPEVTPEAVRARLLQVDSDGLSIVDRLRRERSAGQSWGAPFGPERLVGALRSPLRTPVGQVDQ